MRQQHAQRKRAVGGSAKRRDGRSQRVDHSLEVPLVFKRFCENKIATRVLRVLPDRLARVRLGGHGVAGAAFGLREQHERAFVRAANANRLAEHVTRTQPVAPAPGVHQHRREIDAQVEAARRRLERLLVRAGRVHPAPLLSIEPGKRRVELRVVPGRLLEPVDRLFRLPRARIGFHQQRRAVPPGRRFLHDVGEQRDRLVELVRGDIQPTEQGAHVDLGLLRRRFERLLEMLDRPGDSVLLRGTARAGVLRVAGQTRIHLAKHAVRLLVAVLDLQRLLGSRLCVGHPVLAEVQLRQFGGNRG